MTSKYLFLALLSLSLCFYTCKKEDEKKDDKTCGDETVAGISLFTGEDFHIFEVPGGITENNATYRTQYYTSGNRAFFEVRLLLKQVCGYDNPFVSAELRLLVPDSEVKDTFAYEFSSPADRVIINVPEVSPGFYQLGRTIALPGSQDAMEVLLFSSVRFPTKGSRSADSTYFFTNMTKMSVAINTKKPKS